MKSKTAGEKMNKISNSQGIQSQSGPLTPNEQIGVEKANNSNLTSDSMQDLTAKAVENLNTIIPIGNGYVVDLKRGTINFDIRRLIEEMNGEQVSNPFIEALKKNKYNKMFFSFKELLAGSGNDSADTLKTDLSIKKEQAETLLKKILKEFSNSGSPQNIDSSKEISLQC